MKNIILLLTCLFSLKLVFANDALEIENSLRGNVFSGTVESVAFSPIDITIEFFDNEEKLNYQSIRDLNDIKVNKNLLRFPIKKSLVMLLLPTVIKKEEEDRKKVESGELEPKPLRWLEIQQVIDGIGEGIVNVPGRNGDLQTAELKDVKREFDANGNVKGLNFSVVLKKGAASLELIYKLKAL